MYYVYTYMYYVYIYIYIGIIYMCIYIYIHTCPQRPHTRMLTLIEFAESRRHRVFVIRVYLPSYAVM